MSHSERLVYATRCRLCGGEIEPGTLLENLSWDPDRRVWAHRSPHCEGVALADPAGATQPPVSSNEALSPASLAVDAKVSPRSADGHLLSETASGDWSVTVELHEADDPAQSKRVVRIARLHLRSLREAREVAGVLRGDV